MHEITGNINTSGYLSALERMEEKTMSLEAQNEVLNLSPADSLEQKFAALEQSDRQQLKPSSQESATQEERQE